MRVCLGTRGNVTASVRGTGASEPLLEIRFCKVLSSETSVLAASIQVSGDNGW